MSKKLFVRFAGIAAGTAMVLGFAPVAGAQTVTDLQALIAQLQAQISALQGGSSSSVGAITSDLAVGASGSQVVTLQSGLVASGYLTMPAGVPMGYFGALTKAAVQKWQAAAGLPATGYFGPLSRAKWGGVAGGGTSTGGTVGGGQVGGGVSGSITTPGVEGSITVTKASTPASGAKLYENAFKVPVVGIELEAKTSDIAVRRVKLDLDEGGSGNNDQDLYRKIANRVYLMDGSSVVASMDMNSSTVVEDGNDRFITLAGFSYVVPRNQKRVLTVALDSLPTFDSAYNGDTWTIGVPVNGVRGVDGAGIDVYGPTTAFTQNFTSQDELAASATLAVSTNSSTPKAQQVIATLGVDEDEINGLELLKADFRAEKDNVKVTDLVVDLVRAGYVTATATTAYLMDGSTILDSASVAATSDTLQSITFDNVDFIVNNGTTRTLRVVVDLVDASTGATTFAADIDTADVTAENSLGDGITESGSATGNTFTVRKVGPEVALVSKSITTSGVPQGPITGGNSTSTLTANFTLRITAKGSDLLLGTVASGTPTAASSTASFKVYRNGAYDAVLSSISTTTSFSLPSTCVAEGTNTCRLAENQSIEVPVSFLMQGRSAAVGTALSSGLYAIQLEGVQWTSANGGASATTTNFMSGNVDWRTAEVSFP